MLYWLCKEFGMRPDEMLEQDWALISRMRTLAAAYNSVQRVRGLKGEAIHNMDPADGEMIAWLRDQGVM